MLVNNCFVVGIFKKMCKMIERKTKYEKVIFTVEENEKIADATSKSLFIVTHGTLWFQIEQSNVIAFIRAY